MINTDNKIMARFNSKVVWVTLWIVALFEMFAALRALSLIKPKTCIAMCIAAFVFCIAGTLVGMCAGRTRLEVGEKFVFCKTLFGKQMYLPLDTVTGIKTTFFRTVCIYAPSCSIKCPFVVNGDELVDAIKEKIEGR